MLRDMRNIPEEISAGDSPVGAARKWMITGAVMIVTVMQVLDVTVINVALPHMQG